MYKHILLATDGTKLSREAAIQAIQIARTLAAKITVLTVVRGYRQAFRVNGFVLPVSGMRKERFEEQQAKRANTILDEVKKAAARYGVQCFSSVVFGDRPYQAIIKHAGQSRCDLIVMASRGRGTLSGLLLGSETQKVLTYSKIPVLVCR